MAGSITSNLLNTVNASSGLSSLFGSSTSFGNPFSLAATAQAVLAFQTQFPTSQALALSGLYTQVNALGSSTIPLVLSASANQLLVNAKSPVLPPSAFNQTTATSSNTAALGATSLAGATLTSYQVGVNALAVAQVNTGTSYTSASANTTGITSGTVSVSVNGGPAAQANYHLFGTETNEQALTAVASAINSITANHDLQTVTLSGNATSGNFKLSFNGQTTGNLAAGASAATVQAALAGLSTVGGGNVSVTKSGNSYNVAFVGALDGTPLPLLQATNVSLNSGATIATSLVTGPTASVSNVGLTSALVATAGGSGTASSFTFSDAGGNYLTQSGIGNVTTNSQDAAYSVNGATYQSATGNKATLDNGNVSLTFTATTATPATITVSSNTSSLAATVTTFVTAYNNLQTYLSDNSIFLSPALAQQAEAIVTSAAAGLQSIGVTGNTSLAINQTTLASASASAVQSALGGTQGVATRLAQFAQTILTNMSQLFAAAPQPQSNNSQVATALSGQFGDVLLAGQGLGINVSVRA